MTLSVRLKSDPEFKASIIFWFLESDIEEIMAKQLLDKVAGTVGIGTDSEITAFLVWDEPLETLN